MFIGKPDTEYLWWVPDDWKTLLKDTEKVRRETDLLLDPTSDPFANTAVDIDERELQRKLNERNAMEKYLDSIRRESFRRYHFISSYHNIIDNGITLSKRDTYNAIRLKGKYKRSIIGRKVESLVERKLDNMEEGNIRWLYVENDNSWDVRAQPMATSMLMWQLRDIYDGEITILGDPHIRPYDVCFINDLYNDIHGPVEVGQVVHTFSEETGFITQIKPDLFVTIGEIAQRSAMGALGAYSYRWVLNRMGIGWYDEVNSDITKAQRQLHNEERSFAAAAGILTLAGLTALYPLFMGPILLAGYFLGNYIKEHATIRVVPLFHKSYPFITGLEGFRAPESSNALLNQYRLLREGVSESIDAVSDLYRDVKSPHRRNVVLRKLIGL